VLIADDGSDTITDCGGHNNINAGAGIDSCTFDPSDSSVLNCENLNPIDCVN
jgi:hypothetical protein